MIPYIEMRVYVAASLVKYKAFLDLQEIYGFLLKEFNREHTAESILMKYGWRNIGVCKSNRNLRVDEFYSSDYDLRVNVHYCKDVLDKVFLSSSVSKIEWFVSSTIERNTITVKYNGNDVNDGAFSIYCILEHGGNIERAFSAFVLLDRRDLISTCKDYNIEIDYDGSHSSLAPPPLSTKRIIDESKLVNSEAIDLLKKEVEKLNDAVFKLQSTPSKSLEISNSETSKVTESILTNQADGRYNQQYSQAHYTLWYECHYDCYHYFNNTGIPIGYYRANLENQPDKFKNNLIYYQGETHLITIAPTGSGKLTAVQIPALMEYTGSMVVIDPKGECAAISVRQRRNLGQEVIIINPFEILKEEFEKIDIPLCGFNPLAALDKDDDNFVADVSALAEALVAGDDVGNSDPYWRNSARDLITCLIMYVCCSDKEKDNRHLPRVRELLTLDSESLAEMMIQISKDEFRPMAQKAMRFTREESSNASVISTAISNTLFLDDPKLIDNLKRDDFRFDSLKTNYKTTVYIVLPAKFLLAYSQWFRLLITSGLDTLMSTHEKADKNVLFMLDEFPILGRMSCIETAIGLARGYGIQIWMFLQDIHQLNHLYKDKAESFLANTGMQQYFIPNDIITAERISQRMGNTTLIDEKFTRELSAYGYDMNNTPTNVEISHKERPLNYPIEILSFHKDIQLVFFSGNANVVVMDKNYYYDKHMDDGKYTDDGKKLYDDNPYYNA